MLAEVSELQNNAVAQLIENIKNNKKNVFTFKAPTGSGKTFMMAQFMNKMIELNSSIVFLVSSLSKSDLASQNYIKFCEYRDCNGFNQLNPYLINSDIATEERLHIPNDFNVYLLPRDLYKEKSRLMQGPMTAFLTEEKMHTNKIIIWIKDECHIATKNLDELAPIYFNATINFSATPKLSRGQQPDVEITEEDAQNCKLIKTVHWGDDEDTFEDAVNKFNEIKGNYRDLLNVNPCLIVQISNKTKANEEICNIIMPVLNKNPQLKWMLIVNDEKECDTNDVFKAKKLPVSRWKDYAKGNLNGIDIIIFKLVISEGWDIPRACMLYQVRDSQSSQLDEQVVGRVRRNPRLLDYETLSNEAQQLATTAWVWGIKSDSLGKVYGVKLQNNQNDIINSIKVKTTKLKSLSQKEGFCIESFIAKQKPILAHKSIFSIHKEIQNVDYSVQRLVYNYADSFSKWWEVSEHIDSLAKESNQYICDYSKSMEVNEDQSFQPTSYYVATDMYVNISNWVWKRRDGAERFSFDSNAERDWAEILKDISSSSIDSIVTGKKKENTNAGLINLFGEVEKDAVVDEKEIFLWGKNYVGNSTIKFEYYLGAMHSSYPDFIMKDKFGRVHIFEVKSVNQSKGFNFDDNIYIAKAAELKKCYKQASIITDNLFYLPTLKEDIWRITLFNKGEETTLTLDQFRSFVKTVPLGAV